MAEQVNGKSKKVNKNEFLATVAKKNRMTLGEVKRAYDAIIRELESVVCSGCDLSLTGFGTFSLKKHKGHPVQFEAKSDNVSDYVVLKFTASDVLMTKIRSAYAAGVSAADEACAVGAAENNIIENNAMKDR